MTPTTTAKIIEKVRKVLTRVERGSTEGERDAALNLAQEMMLKHGLEMKDVQGSEQVKRDITEEAWGEDLPTDWKSYLLEQLCKASFCHSWFYTVGGGKKQREYSIIGRPENIAYVRALYENLIPQLEGEVTRALRVFDRRSQYARKYCELALYYAEYSQEHGRAVFAASVADGTISDSDLKEAGLSRLLQYKGAEQLEDISRLCGIAPAYASETRPFIKRGEIPPKRIQGQTDLGVFKRSFLMSAGSRIRVRLLEGRNKFEEDTGEAGKALVLDEQARVKAFVEEKHPDLRSVGRSGRTSRAGWEMGAEAGERADISAGTGRLAHERPQLTS